MPVQRWRLNFSRTANAGDSNQREQLAAWDSALEAAGLRDPAAAEVPKLIIAAPIPAGLTADLELADLFLPRRSTAADLRTRLRENMPAGHLLGGLHDVWLGEPALPGLVVAGDYRVEITSPAGPEGAPIDVAGAVATFLAMLTIDRTKTRADRPRSGNLRPLVMDIRCVTDARLWMRLRFDPILGTGRPEEIVQAIGMLAGQPLIAAQRHRERLWLKGEDMT
jgi:hypothetical protein